ncbi:hypothetical protein PABG_12675 [Paracoccidioides brasiliensis Pb03]|nr:hypothetical protein PABG_12675 [Paracoccidioides brasiliensis Pb03]
MAETREPARETGRPGETREKLEGTATTKQQAGGWLTAMAIGVAAAAGSQQELGNRHRAMGTDWAAVAVRRTRCSNSLTGRTTTAGGSG